MSAAGLVSAARDFATASHRRIDHRRKYSKQPYEVHLKAVAELVATVTDDPATIAAAWLHDVVEDTAVTFADVEAAFGADVMSLVKDLTDVSRPTDGNRAVRKAIDRAHLATASPRAQTVKLADLCDNAVDICAADPRFGRVFLDEMEALLAVLGQGDARLMERAQRVLQKCRAGLRKKPDQPGEIARLMNGAPAHELQAVSRQMHAFTVADLARPLSDADEAQLGELDAAQVLNAADSLSTMVHVLTRYDKAYVRRDAAIREVVERHDLERPIGRMWLFGFITLVEMEFTRRIAAGWPDGAWEELLSKGRLEKARLLQQERERRGYTVELLQCLQLSDKAAILLQAPNALIQWGFSSKSAAQAAARDLEALRNDLAHAQALVDRHWHQIARLCQRFDEGLREGAGQPAGA